MKFQEHSKIKTFASSTISEDCCDNIYYQTSNTKTKMITESTDQ